MSSSAAGCEMGDCPPPDADRASTRTPAASTIATNGSGHGEDPLDWTTFSPPFDASSFSSDHLAPSIVIEFCNRCRWQHRATWVQTELFLTFEDKAAGGAGEREDSAGGAGKYATAVGLKSITLIPCNASETGGRFRVWLYRRRRNDECEQAGETVETQCEIASKDARPHGSRYAESGVVTLLWDRKIRGGFPELKELKQMVRDQISPSTSLGHSDKKAASKT